MIDNIYDITIFPTQKNEEQILKPQSILDILQYSAVRQSLQYHIDGPSIEYKGIIWVLVNLKYEIIGDASKLNFGKVRTYPRVSNSKIKKLRDFIIYNEQNEPIIKATSVWCFLSLKTGLPCVDETVCFPEPLKEEHIFDQELRKLTFKKDESFVFINEFPILNSYYDTNKHTNNSFYGLFIYECLSNKNNVKSLQIDYISQTHIGDNVAIFKSKISAEHEYFLGYVGDRLIFKADVEVE